MTRSRHYHQRYVLTPAAHAALSGEREAGVPDTYQARRDPVYVLTEAGHAALDEALPTPARQESTHP